MAGGNAGVSGRANNTINDINLDIKIPYSIEGIVMQLKSIICHLVALITFNLISFGFCIVQFAGAQETNAIQTDELERLIGSKLANNIRQLSGGSESITPTPEVISNMLSLFSTSPLTRNDVQQSETEGNRSTLISSEKSNQSSTPITFQLPPHPPEKYAPASQWRPPIQLPEPSTIPTPPMVQAPIQQRSPPIKIPNPSGATTETPPIQLPVIPLPPHPPEEQAPWRSGE